MQAGRRGRHVPTPRPRRGPAPRAHGRLAEPRGAAGGAATGSPRRAAELTGLRRPGREASPLRGRSIVAHRRHGPADEGTGAGGGRWAVGTARRRGLPPPRRHGQQQARGQRRRRTTGDGSRPAAAAAAASQTASAASTTPQRIDQSARNTSQGTIQRSVMSVMVPSSHARARPRTSLVPLRGDALSAIAASLASIAQLIRGELSASTSPRTNCSADPWKNRARKSDSRLPVASRRETVGR